MQHVSGKPEMTEASADFYTGSVRGFDVDGLALRQRASGLGARTAEGAEETVVRDCVGNSRQASLLGDELRRPQRWSSGRHNRLLPASPRSRCRSLR